MILRDRTDRVLRAGMEWLGGSMIRRLDTGPPTTLPPAADPAAPVVLVGGFGATDPVMLPLARALAARGHPVTVVTDGAAAGCAGRAADALTDRVAALATGSRRRVHLVGHSRGGQFARAAACRAPDPVASLTTLGTPFSLYGLGPLAFGTGVAVVLGGTLGVPGLATLACLAGACCRDYRGALRGPWPAHVPLTTVVGAGDRTVPPAANHVPGAHEVVVDGDHLQLLTAGAAHRAVVEAIDQADRDAARSLTSV